MSSILYYSNFCDHSKKLLQSLSKFEMKKEIHFICIDNRIQEGNKTFIILQNGQKIIMPENITKVPALLLLDQNYKVLYGEMINDFFKPKQQMAVKQATNNNFEPSAFSFGSGGNIGISSDNYSFLDMDSSALSATGNGGLRQMHSYIGYNDSFNITTPVDEYDYKSTKISEDLTVEQLQQQRANELNNIAYKN